MPLKATDFCASNSIFKFSNIDSFFLFSAGYSSLQGYNLSVEATIRTTKTIRCGVKITGNICNILYTLTEYFEIRI